MRSLENLEQYLKNISDLLSDWLFNMDPRDPSASCSLFIMFTLFTLFPLLTLLTLLILILFHRVLSKKDVMPIHLIWICSFIILFSPSLTFDQSFLNFWGGRLSKKAPASSKGGRPPFDIFSDIKVNLTIFKANSRDKWCISTSTIVPASTASLLLASVIAGEERKAF